MERRFLMIVLAAILLVVGVAVYFSFDPSVSSWFPKCPFLSLSGYKCPGCGSQRAIHALLHGDWMAACRFNVILVLSLPFIVLMLLGLLLRRRCPRFDAMLNSTVVIWTFFTVIMLWWVLRNIFDW